MTIYTGTCEIDVPASSGSGMSHGECRLDFVSTTQIKLNPYNGNRIIINGAQQTIPDAGVTLSNSGLTASTRYYVYAYMNAGVMTLEASATGYAKSSGVFIKSGDATRTLVGGVYIWTDGTFRGGSTVTHEGHQLVRTWFNDPGIHGETSMGSDVTITSTAFVEIDTALRMHVFVWADEIPQVSLTGYMSNTQQASNGVSIGFDTQLDDTAVIWASESNANFYMPICVVGGFPRLSEGYHYFTASGRVNAGTGKWYGPGGHGTPTSLQLDSRK